MVSSAIDRAADAMPEIGRIIDQLTFPLNVAAGLEARGFDPARRRASSARIARIYEKIVSELGALFERHELQRGAAAKA